MSLHLYQHLQSLKAKREQNSFDCSSLYSAKKIIIFLVPARKFIAGGILSIVNLCETTRKIVKDAQVVISTFPSFDTYCKIDWFDNDEKIYRFSQVICDKITAEEVYIHIPEYLSGKFYKKLSENQKMILKNIKILHINILNQNIRLMPEYEKIKDLLLITKNLTQTTAHARYATQQICDQWKIPLHHFSAYLPSINVEKQPIEKKKKNMIIVFSNDKNTYKNIIYNKLVNNLENCTILTVSQMTYQEYFDLIAKAFCVITFGEGFDAYFMQPLFVGTLGIAVYNDDFFPDKKWKDNDNVYSSFAEMKEHISDYINYLINNSTEYYKTIDINKKMISDLYSYDKYKINIQKFYQEYYDYIPNKFKKLISTKGYWYSGSSALIGFFNEFSNIKVYGIKDDIYCKDKEPNTVDSELKFFWCTNIVDFIKAFSINSRLEKDRQIKRFINDIYRCYDTKGAVPHEKNPDFYNDEFLKIMSFFLYRVLDLDDYSLQFMKNRRFPACWNSPDETFNNCSFMKEKGINQYLFYKFKDISQQYFDNIVKYIFKNLFNNISTRELLVVDQGFVFGQLEKVNHYLDNKIKEIAVYRDPRDQYLSLFRAIDGISVSRNANDFVKYYKNRVEHDLQQNYEHRLMIRFEDLVLKYNETTQKIMDFCGIDPAMHIHPKTVFDPAISVVNIGSYKYFIDQDFMRQIEEKLGEYCYYPEKENLSEEAWNLLKSVQ